MAISLTHYQLLAMLKADGLLPQNCDILEIGEANLYGDFNPRVLGEKLPIESLAELENAIEASDTFALARILYRVLFAPKSVTAIDTGGPTALQLDLNNPIKLATRFDVTINHGTAEHVFNIGTAFRSMHDNTKADGLIISESPFTGWVDHGFYCLQPTLYWDMAAANGYEMVLFAWEHLASKTFAIVERREQVLEAKRRGQLADGLMLFIVMRKVHDAPFRVPMQGVYSGAVSEEATKAWREQR